MQKVRHERSLARDPFKLKMKVKLEPVTLREYEKRRQRRRRSETKDRERALGKKKKIVASNTYCEPCGKSFPTPAALKRHARLAHAGNRRRKRRRSSSDEDEEYAAPSAPKQVKYKTSDKMEVGASIARMAMQEMQTLQNPDQNAKWENDRMGANISRMARNKLQELQANKLKYEFRPASTSSTLRKVRKGLKAADHGPNSIEILYLEFRLEKLLEFWQEIPYTKKKLKNGQFTGRPDRMPTGNGEMGRMVSTGQCGPFCPFLCFLWASCPVAL